MYRRQEADEQNAKKITTMKITNAIKKLEKAGFNVTAYGCQFAAQRGNDIIEFSKNGGGSDSVICIRVRSVNDQDDSYSDYSAGVFCDNISQAIRLAV